MSTAVAEYESHGGSAKRPVKALWPWFAIYAGTGVVLVGFAMGAWRIFNNHGTQLRIWNVSGVAFLSVCGTVAIALALWCVQRMIERMPKQSVWAVTLLMTGVVAAMALLKIWFDARGNVPASRMMLLVSAIVVGVLGLLSLGQAMRCSRIEAESQVRPRWMEVAWELGNHLILAIQFFCAAAAVGAGIVLGFGYPVP